MFEVSVMAKFYSGLISSSFPAGMARAFGTTFFDASAPLCPPCQFDTLAFCTSSTRINAPYPKITTICVTLTCSTHLLAAQSNARSITISCTAVLRAACMRFVLVESFTKLRRTRRASDLLSISSDNPPPFQERKPFSWSACGRS